METTSSCAAPADPDPGQTTYSCEECDEYLLIHEASASSSEEHPPTLNQDVLQDASSNGKILKVEGEVTSGPPSAGTEQDSAPQEVVVKWANGRIRGVFIRGCESSTTCQVTCNARCEIFFSC